MEGPDIHQFMSLEKGLSDLDTVFDGTRISIGGLHWDYILCVYLLLVSNKVSNSRRVRGNWMVQAVKQWVHCWFTVGCSVILTHTIQLKRIPIAIAWCVPWCICWSIPCAVQTFAGQPSILAE